jgi:hypothetical protein
LPDDRLEPLAGQVVEADEAIGPMLGTPAPLGRALGVTNVTMRNARVDGVPDGYCLGTEGGAAAETALADRGSAAASFGSPPPSARSI